MFVYIVILYINFHGCDFFRRVGVVGVGGGHSQLLRGYSVFHQVEEIELFRVLVVRFVLLWFLRYLFDIIILISQ